MLLFGFLDPLTFMWVVLSTTVNVIAFYTCAGCLLLAVRHVTDRDINCGGILWFLCCLGLIAGWLLFADLAVSSSKPNGLIGWGTALIVAVPFIRAIEVARD